MRLADRRVLVTGGAGFIGSNLVDALMERGNSVLVYDNLSSGRREFLAAHEGKEGFELRVADVLDKAKLEEAVAGCDAVFHVAANPDVKAGNSDTRTHLEQNVIATHNMLEAMRVKGVKAMYFTSTSTVYGETDLVPTPETFGPLEPISLYGASKLASEALISAYAHSFDMTALCFRFANVVGPRSTHGVTYDFVNKLRKDPSRLEILGNDPGTRKSYVHIDDTVSGIIHACEKSTARVDFYNVGSEDLVDVRTIAEIVCDEMGLEEVEFAWTGAADGRGWKGDVRLMQLSIGKLKALGWVPEYTSAQAIAAAARSILVGG